MESSLYVGTVKHTRLHPITHSFAYRLYMLYVDLSELPMLWKKGILSKHRFGRANFDRRDHFGDPNEALDQTVRNLVHEKTGMQLTGPIRLLTQLRTFGYYFSPLNLFYCFADDGETLEAVVAEVQNTPWKERHCYVLWNGNRDDLDGLHKHPKAFHVSPFLPMDMEYRWQVGKPAEQLAIRIQNYEQQTERFRALLTMNRVPMDVANLSRFQNRYPLMTLQIMTAIHIQAFQLWRKQCPFFVHPSHRNQQAEIPKSEATSSRALSTERANADSFNA